ncbi:MAG: TAXI family TRAP transporter solute-binding subunit [Myxococcales bacterium]|nr:TAXI family TRAP transporter solute-binding subunit [Myxococcales bacterium]
MKITKRWHQLLGLTLLVVGFAIAGFFGKFSLGSRSPQSLTITTGTPGGTYIELGQQLSRILEGSQTDHIGSVTSIDSSGSVQNIERLINGEADLALAIETVVAKHTAEHPERDQLRALMFLYVDRVHLVVRSGRGILKLSDLAGKRIFIGADGSGTKLISNDILLSAGISEADYQRVAVKSFADASLALQTGTADAAFIVASTLAKAVTTALSSGCCSLLDLANNQAAITKIAPGLKAISIPGRTFPNQPNRVGTVGGAAILVARKDLPIAVATDILAAIFDNLDALDEARIPTQSVRLDRALADRSSGGVKMHAGSRLFLKAENKKLLIATGMINGKYYRIGKQIEIILQHAGIPARVTQTGGSVENLKILQDSLKDNSHPPALAIVQYDVVVNSFRFRPKGNMESRKIPYVSGLQRIANLHEEKLHALVRRDLIPDSVAVPTLNLLNGLNVCTGPDQSGTQELANAALHHHRVVPKSIAVLSIPDMVERMHSREIDAGFFVSHVPNESLKTIAHDRRFRLLSVDSSRVTAMLGPAIWMSRIEPGVYGAQLEGEPVIETVSTRAVLVTTGDLPFDVYKITQAVYEGAAFLGISETTQTMAQELLSLPLHPDAMRALQDQDILPRPQHYDWLKDTWRGLAILVMVGGGFQGFITMRREATQQEIRRRIIALNVGADSKTSVSDLQEIRSGFEERGRRGRWQRGFLDSGRVAELNALVEKRAIEARSNSIRNMLSRLRALWTPTGLDAKTLVEHYDSLERESWVHLENGELDSSQHSLLLNAIKDRRSEIRCQQASREEK